MNKREIKFRAWDKILNKWVHPVFDITNPFLLSEGLYVMQYTGLIDKNGVEIYEGDVIQNETYNIRISDNKKVDGSEHTNNYIVEWSTKPFVCGWQLRKVGTSKNNKFGIGQITNTSLHYIIHKSKVIGNIHENTELL